jgi:uncharacterized protein YaaQ
VPFKYSSGGAAYGSIRTIVRPSGQRTTLTDEVNGWNARMHPHLYEDFLTSGGIFTGTGVKIAGTVTSAFVANAADGLFRLATDAANEAQSGRLSLNDQLVIPGAKRPKMWALVKIPTITTAERLVIGFASAYTAVLDNIVRNVWFKLDANMSLVVEADDATTDIDDRSINTSKMSATLVTGTTYLFGIDMSDLANIQFWINDLNVTPTTPVTASAIASSSGGLLQPFVLIQKDSGTDVLTVDVDWVRCRWDRTNYA